MVESGFWIVLRSPATAAFSSLSGSLLLPMLGEPRDIEGRVGSGGAVKLELGASDDGGASDDESCDECGSAIFETLASTFFSKSWSDIVREVLSNRSIKSIAPPCKC
jgi:hypothetical protein